MNETSTKKGGVRVKMKAGVGRIKQAVGQRLATRRSNKAAILEKERAQLLESIRTSITRAKEIFGDDMYTIDDCSRKFRIDSKLKMNADLLYVPFSEEQLKAMFGYALLAIVFPSTKHITKWNKGDIKISETIFNNPLAEEVFEKNMYPRFHLIMKPDLSLFYEGAALGGARGVGLQEEHTSLVAQISVLVLENSKRPTSKSIRTVSFPTSDNLQVTVSYDPQTKPAIVVETVEKGTPIRKAISWTNPSTL